MNRDDYLNPHTLKTQCRFAINQLEKDNKSIKAAKSSINAFLNNTSSKGTAITSAKNHIAEYLTVFSAQEQANNCDINDYRSLSRRVGNEILDGEKIFVLFEKKRKSMYRKLEMADYFRQAENFDIDVVDFGYSQIARWYENSAEIDRQICRECENKMQIFDEIVKKTNGLFEDSAYMRETVSVAVAGLVSSFVGGKYISNSNSSWRKDLKLASYGVTRPSGVSDSEWNAYKTYTYEKINDMDSKGWSKDSIKAYVNYINKNATGKNAVKKLRQINEEANTVGSEVFKEMWYAWDTHGEEKEARKKIKTVMNVVGMEDLTGNPEQTEKLLSHFDSDLAPHDPFWHDFAKTIQEGYPDGFSEGDEDARLIHQFRYVIDAQQVQYVRVNYKEDGMTDEDALAKYLSTLDKDEWTADESSRLHQKTKRGHEPEGMNGSNLKVTVGFHSEFIISGDGSFAYVLDPEGKENSIVNGASFNYADRNDAVKAELGSGKHERWDIDPARKEKNGGQEFDPEFRNTKGYESPITDYKAIVNWVKSESGNEELYRKYEETLEKRRMDFEEKIKSYN